MNTREREDLLDKALRQRLTDAEQKRWEELLAEDPALREGFAKENALERALDALPNAPISSNFTALVLQAATRETQERAGVGWRIRWPWLRFAPAAALTLVLGTGGFLGYRQHLVQREEMALNVRSFSEVASVVAASEQSPAEVFQNFDAIQRLPLPSEGDLDMELLVALQK